MKILSTHKRSRVSRKLTHRTILHAFRDFVLMRQQRGHLARLLIGILGTLLIVVVLQSWIYPFQYRRWDRFPNGLAASRTFEVINPIETAREVKEQERLVPLIFRNQSHILEQFPSQLKASLGAIAEAETPEDLNDDVRLAFGLVNQSKLPEVENLQSGGGLALEASDEMKFRFQQLKQEITPPDAQQSETHISSIVDEFKRFIQPIYKTGLIDPKDLRRRELDFDAPLAIVAESAELPKPNPLANTDQWIGAHITDVSLADLLNDAGFLGQRWSDFPRLEPIQSSLEQWMRNQMQARPTLVYDQASTQTARRWAGQQVEPVYDLINESDEFLPPGGVVDQVLLEKLEAQYEASLKDFPPEARMARAAIVFLLVGVLLSLTGWYVARYESRIISSWKRLSVYLMVLAAATFLGRLCSFDPIRCEAAIVAATAMIIAISYNQRFALVTAFLLSLLICMGTRVDISQFLIMLTAASAAVVCLRSVQSRSTIVKAGFLSGLTTFIVAWGLEILQYPTSAISFWVDPILLLSCLTYAGWAILAGFILAGSLPFIESTFGVVTGISLLELSDPSHELLQELVRRAPGTYNHSVSLATIAEAAAKEIGANGLLVRVGAYFHDVGKIPKAEYFIENRTAGMENRHDTLAPAMSTLIIIGHVKDGVELAEEYRLPRVIIDFIEQHHGTTLVEFFYHAANKKADAEPERKLDVEEAAFRYPGPKPQSKEAGVLMLADCVESASRTLSEPTPARIRTLVHQLTMKRLLDGQFDECALKLSEIHRIEESLIKSLISMHHGRIAYPESEQVQKTA